MQLEPPPPSIYVALGAAVLVLAPACMLQDFDELGSALGTGGAQTGVGQGGDAQGGSGGSAGAAAAGASGSGGDAGASGASGASDENIIPNPGFEAGHASWVGFGGSTILDWSMGARTGDKCIASMNRTEAWQGPSYNALPLVTAGETYEMSAWVRMEAGLEPVTLSLKSVCSDGVEVYTSLASAIVDTEWTPMAGLITVPDCGLTELAPYFEGPAANAVFFLDDASLKRLP